jgi:chromosome segregation ATPase
MMTDLINRLNSKHHRAQTSNLYQIETIYDEAATRIKELEAERKVATKRNQKLSDKIEELEGMFAVSRDSHLAANKRNKKLEAQISIAENYVPTHSIESYLTDKQAALGEKE